MQQREMEFSLWLRRSVQPVLTLATLLCASVLVSCGENGYQQSQSNAPQTPDQTQDQNPNPSQDPQNFTAGSYIVVLKKSNVARALMMSGLKPNTLLQQSARMQMHSDRIIHNQVQDLADRHRIITKQDSVFTRVLQGGVFELTRDQALEIQQDEQVAYIEKDQVIHVNFQQASPVWGLDRLDQKSLPLDSSYRGPDGGAQVNAYIIDTGVLITHQEFQGRAFSGFDFVDNDSDATDCNGHGTHVAGTIGSRSYGVAKNVKLFGVRVLDCSGSGQFSDVIKGIEWVTRNHIKPAVANMSLGGGVSQAVDDAVSASIQAGVTYAVAAGNENSPACGGSPARVAAAITVGSTTISDARSSFSNFGSCVDIFAPGSDIKSTWFNSNSAVNTISGTSMATPHVAGAAALYLSLHPQATPLEVRNALVGQAVLGKISDSGSGSPNVLLNLQFLLNDGSQPPPSPSPAPSPAPSPVPQPSPIPQPTPKPVPSPSPNPAPCVNCDLYQGSLSSKGSANYHPSISGFSAKSGVQQYWLKGPVTSGLDFDIYLYKKSGSSWVQVAKASGSSSTEQISYSGTAGSYQLKVISYSGSGSYLLYRKLP